MTLRLQTYFMLSSDVYFLPLNIIDYEKPLVQTVPLSATCTLLIPLLGWCDGGFLNEDNKDADRATSCSLADVPCDLTDASKASRSKLFPKHTAQGKEKPSAHIRFLPSVFN
jgi:hypothetical protein